MNWLPIEIAPRYGRALVLVEGVEYVARRGRASWVVAMPACRSADVVDPTHWMPLPPPPEAES